MRKIFLANHDRPALIDDEDYDLISDYGWFAYRDLKSEKHYVRANDGEWGSGDIVHLQRLIMDAGPGQAVMFIDRDPLNCRKANLKVATRQQISAHTVGHHRRQKLKGNHGYKGVFTRDNRWYAQLKANGKVYTGRYRKHIEDAARDYDSLSRKHNGELGHLNFPGDQK